jgi:shikimate dehydrogenase
VTARAFVIGHPIAHSRSPLIHGSWLRTYGIDASYEAIDVAPEALPAFFERLRGGEFVGGNVTVPLKQRARELCDTLDPDTLGIGAVNTLTTSLAADSQRLIHGTNTDYYGFLANLDQAAPGWSAGRGPAIVLGAGGAARAVVTALVARAFEPIHILNRTPHKAVALAAELAGPLAGAGLDSFAELAPGAALLVNTTSVGMHGTAFPALALEALPRTALVTDLVYVPLETPLLAAARARGLTTVDGLGMLLHQAVPGFEAWFGVRPEVTPALRRAVEATL